MTVVEFWVEQYNAVVAEKKTLGEKLRETLEENKDLQQQNGVLKKANDTILSANMDLARKKEHLEDRIRYFKKELDEAEKELVEKIEILNAVQDRLDLKAQLEDLTQRYENALKDGKERLDKSIADRAELQADRDIWFRKNGEKLAEIEELKKKIQSLEDDLKSKACSRNTWRTEAERLRKELTESYSNGYSDGNEEGQNELWEMLQMVKDMQPNEFDVECECLGDVIDMDLEDFKEAYGKWEEEKKKAAEEAKKKHVEYMRDYLKRYCIGKLCFGCPLYNASEPVSSCLFSKLTDEEIEKRYRKVVDIEWEKAPRYFKSTIEAVFTAEAKINEDILKVVCGIKDDKK